MVEGTFPVTSFSQHSESTSETRRKKTNDPYSLILVVGHVCERNLRLLILGTALILMIVGGLLISVFHPELNKDIWLILGPIVSGTMGYLVGNSKSSNGDADTSNRRNKMNHR